MFRPARSVRPVPAIRALCAALVAVFACSCATPAVDRAELAQIRAELAALRQSVTEIHRATVAQPKPVRQPETPAVVGKVSLRDSETALGVDSAPVVIVEYTDYECPYCARFNAETFPVLKARYVDTGQVRYIVRDFPLGFHAGAIPASIAARCAIPESKYWPMRDALFASQADLSEAALARLAAKVGLDAATWNKCRQDPQVLAGPGGDLTSGIENGISGTPGFLIGRVRDGAIVDARRLTGAQGVSAFAAIIDPLLAAPAGG